MNKNTFRLNNDLQSFKLDREVAYYMNKFKELIRANFFELFGIWQGTLCNLRENVSKKNFNEPQELFESVINFFRVTYPSVNLCIYQHQFFDNSLVLYIWNSKWCPLKIFLDDKSNDYINEKSAFHKDNFNYNIRWVGIWAKAAIRVHWYVFAFYIEEKNYVKYLRSLSSIFIIWIADIITAKLLIIENKYTDPRTWLLNSKYVTEIWCKKPYSIIKIDIDDFKVLNDTYWHSEWDRVLENLWLIFKTMIWLKDKACRDWWDEFSLLIDTVEESVLNKILARIKEKIDDFNQSNNFPVSIAVWYCVYESGLSFAERADIADENMYKTKNKTWYIYRLANKISEIKDPEVYNKLLLQILEGSCCQGKIPQVKELLNIK